MNLSIRENKLSSEHNKLNKNQRRHKAIYNHKVRGPSYRNEQEVLLDTPVVPIGQNPKFISPWRAPYAILKCFNDVNYQIQEVSTRKESVLNYDRLKPFRRKPRQRTSQPEKKFLKLRLQTLVYRPEIGRLVLQLLRMISIIPTAPSGHLYQHLNTLRLP